MAFQILTGRRGADVRGYPGGGAKSGADGMLWIDGATGPRGHEVSAAGSLCLPSKCSCGMLHSTISMAESLGTLGTNAETAQHERGGECIEAGRQMALSLRIAGIIFWSKDWSWCQWMQCFGQCIRTIRIKVLAAAPVMASRPSNAGWGHDLPLAVAGVILEPVPGSLEVFEPSSLQGHRFFGLHRTQRPDVSIGPSRAVAVRLGRLSVVQSSRGKVWWCKLFHRNGCLQR